MFVQELAKRIVKQRTSIARAVAIMICGGIFASTFYMYPDTASKKNDIRASAEENTKDFKFTKRAVPEGTTVDAQYLWPDEINPQFTRVYRNGSQIEDKMVTVTPGSVYHFRGTSEDTTLYTQVYVGIIESVDVMSGETGTWYRLLPSSIRNTFEEDGWTWETGWEYTGRAFLDSENKRVMVKNKDHTAVLYGVGLYLDDINGYSNDEKFIEEGVIFKNAFGATDNMFASAVEYYYSRGGELNSKCPGIYAMVRDIMAGLDVEVKPAEISDAETDEPTDGETPSEPELRKDLLEYVNIRRAEIGLPTVMWDDEDDDNIIIRVREIATQMAQIRPDGTDAFTAYTDKVMCEIRLSNISDVNDIFECAESYFLDAEVVSFNCAVYGSLGVLIFIW